MASQMLKFEKHIAIKPAQVYYAFTNASALREWLCDLATVDPRPGGRIYLYWNSGYYSSGEYTALEAERRVAFTWCGRNEPGRSQVQVTLDALEDGTGVLLEHILPDDGGDWERVSAEIEKGWRSGLENLVSVLETGRDLRYVNRPMLGILLSDFNAELAHKLGVPVTQGVRIDNVVDGMGAQAAGLRASDVIVRIDGQEVRNFSELPSILSGKLAGDQVEVVFYRGPLSQTVMMELSRRPLPEIPPNASALAQAAQKIFDRCVALLDETLEGVSDAQASFRPAPGEWTVKEVLGHLIQGERLGQFSIVDTITGYDSWSDDWGGNLDAHVQATVEAYPTLAELLDELKRAYKETTALYARLPDRFPERRGSYWRVAHNALQETTHLDGHLDQIKKAIRLARQVE